MFVCLRAGAGKAAQPTARLPHQVHRPTVCSQGKELVVTHIFVHVHLSLQGDADVVSEQQTTTHSHLVF